MGTGLDYVRAASRNGRRGGAPADEIAGTATDGTGKRLFTNAVQTPAADRSPRPKDGVVASSTNGRLSALNHVISPAADEGLDRDAVNRVAGTPRNGRIVSVKWNERAALAAYDVHDSSPNKRIVSIGFDVVVVPSP